MQPSDNHPGWCGPSWPCVYGEGLWESGSLPAEVASELGFESKRAMGQWIQEGWEWGRGVDEGRGG